MREHAVREVVPRFGFAASEIESVERVPQRLKNVNYRVRAGGADWVLKRYTAPQAERLRFTHGLERELAKSGFPLAQLRTAPTGESFLADETGIYTLHRWVVGSQISIDQRDATIEAHPNMVADLGATLGRFHLLTSRMALPELAHPVAADRLLGAPRRAAATIRRGRPPEILKELRLRLRPRKSPFDRWILEQLPALYQHAERLATTPLRDRIDATGIVVSHHDINWENLVFDHDFQLQALLDFDNATTLQRDLDVGLAAAVLVGPDAERLTTFLAAYSEAAEHAVDRSLVELGIEVRCARSILWSINFYLDHHVADEGMLQTWCAHMYECLDEVSSSRHRALLWFGAMAPLLESADALARVIVL